MNVCVIGQGYVGLPISLAAAESGYLVFAFDNDLKKLNSLKLGETSSPDIDKNRIIELQRSKKLKFISKLEENYKIDVFIICVPTPLDRMHEPDLTYLREACKTIAKFAKSGTLVINESTSFIGTLKNLIKPLIEELSSETGILYAVAPERIDPGNLNWGLKNTPRIISGLSSEAIDAAIKFYSKFCDYIYAVPKSEIAEMAKLIENSFRQINIAFINELASIAHKFNFSVHEAVTAASTKPFGYMPFYPSIGVGGHCIPVDPSYLNFSANSVGLESNIISVANRINLSMPEQVTSLIETKLNFDFNKKLVQIAGISYKIGVPDVRESPAIALLKILEQKGAKVIYFDPYVKSFQHRKSEPLRTDIDLGLIVTPHEQIDFNIWKDNGTKVVDLSVNKKYFGWSKFL